MIPDVSSCDVDHAPLLVQALPRLRVAALRLCKDRDAAADLVQDTLVKALASRPRFVEEGQLVGWLLTIMRHLFADGWRRADSRPPRPFDLPARSWAAAADETLPRWRCIDDDQLQAAMAALPESMRLTFELHVSDRRSHSALGRQLGVNRATVATRLLRARRRLAELLVPANERASVAALERGPG
jgi:RNA polymerase sigma-70 factor (ECF subfamily)